MVRGADVAEEGAYPAAARQAEGAAPGMRVRQVSHAQDELDLF